MEFHLVQTGEFDVTSESFKLFFTNMFLSRAVYVSSSETKVYNINFEGREKVILSGNQWPSVNSKIEKQVV